MTSKPTRHLHAPVDRVSSDLVSSARDLERLDLIDRRRMAHIKTLCLDAPPAYGPRRVAAIRKRKARMSQAVFARMLNVSVSTVQKWEAPGADKHPSGAAAKLLQVIERKGIEALT